MPAKGGAGERTLGVCAWPGVGLRCCGRCERVSCASRGPQQPHLQHGAAVSANDATGLRFSYLSAFARGSPVDTHDVRRPCPCGTRLRPELVLGEIVIDSLTVTIAASRDQAYFPVTTTVSKAPGIITDRARPPDEARIKNVRLPPANFAPSDPNLLSTRVKPSLLRSLYGDDAGGPGGVM